MSMILITRDIFITQNRGGISRYFVELAKQLSQMQVDFVIDAREHTNIHLADALDNDKLLARHALSSTNNKYKKLRRFTDAFPLLPTSRIKTYLQRFVIHRSYYPIRETACKERLVTTIHDLIDERFGFGLKTMLKSRIKRASALNARRIVVVSESTKQDVMYYWGIPEERIRVIYHGVTSNDLPSTRFEAPGPYALYVGSRAYYKNFGSLLQALSALRTRSLDLYLIAVGGGMFSQSEEDQIRRLDLSDRVLQIDADDSKLVSVYHNASVFVLPSQYEGFGLPLLEAMQNGCPVCCSDRSSLPEVAGSAAAFFDPGDLDSITSTIENVLVDTKQRQQLIEAGYKRVAEFTWRRSAEQHLALYSELE